ncbi:hypothetical protein SAMN04488040_1986 [Sulfitobacter marinus]|uniref:Uncharacterized protein n=1 Tax=Sulfitobacter marinus TaxID=394264 RepID=A0A1I6T204_9RHOB|nr:hypothetical protein [Sulfitobacter marinus]SFS83017.1 hypothetical protein SAMN04488040_1986 [Sulfitobacter marinus]
MTIDLFVGSLMILTLAAIAIVSLTTRKRDDEERNRWSNFQSDDDDQNNLPGM